MKTDFIIEMCQSFLTDYSEYFDLDGKNKENKLEEMVQSIVYADHFLYETDLESYNTIHEMSKWDQAKFIKSYLLVEYNDEMTLDEDQVLEEIGLIAGASIAVSMAGLIIALIKRRSISKGVFGLIKLFGDFFNGIGKFLSKSRTWSYRYTLIQKNFDACYKECGVDKKSIPALSYLAVKRDHWSWLPEKSSQVAVCMTNCFFKNYLEIISLLSEMCFICLRTTNKFDQVSNITKNDALSVISGLRLSESCSVYYDQLRIAYKHFEELLDYVYDENNRLEIDGKQIDRNSGIHTKQQWYDEAAKSVIKAKNKVANTNDRMINKQQESLPKPKNDRFITKQKKYFRLR